ncbi:bacillithiol biosynthesis deacetylase BshB1 [Planctomycetota bacterium]|nr:bacillithiol biosynthesis deacetylase BshB1 [Planctomycetota bacterium]
MTNPIDLLAIGAHPDDVEMSSGGWLAKAADQGYRTGILHLTRGEMGTHGTPEQREAEAREAAKILGCSAIEFAGLKDGYVDDDVASIAIVAEFIRKLEPRMVIAPNTVCHHPDHEAAARLAQKAVHFAGLKGFESGLPHHRVNRLVTARYSAHFDPSFYVDISDFIDQKRRAIMAYKSQFGTVVEDNGQPATRMSKPGFLDQFLARSAAAGLKCGCYHAEEYHVGTGPVVNDPIQLFGEGPDQHLIR